MSDTSAVASQRGDKYQDYYALFIMLKTLNDPNSRQKDLSIKIEGLDDIELSENGKICKLIQTKHITTGKLLRNSSEAFWKTIGIWSEVISEDKIHNPEKISFSLVATVGASLNHAPKLLSEGKIEKALSEMQAFIEPRIGEAIEKTKNKKKTTPNEKAFLKFEKLDECQKLNLLKSTKIHLNEPNLDEIKLKIKSLLDILSAIRKEHLNKFYDDMVDWWIGKIGTDYLSIRISEVKHKIEDLRDKYIKGTLPAIGTNNLSPDESAKYDGYVFVKQLKAINKKRQIEEAKRHYQDIYSHSSYWIREDYLTIKDIIDYQEKLKREGWESIYNAKCDDFEAEKEQNIEDIDDEKALQKLGRDIYNGTLTHHIPIKGFSEEYIMKGSYHVLANKEQIHWHPKFLEWLKKQG